MPFSIMFDPEFASTRESALTTLKDFIPRTGKYSRDRNHVIPGHGNVSRLSPAIRHRLLTEWEVAQAPLSRYAASTLEKFTQEIYWRNYWKSWLSLRPQVWEDYEESITKPDEDAQAIMAGEGPIGVMNLFARELRRTGYLHNHARMWFAGYWIHIARLPWQWGARFFEQELLDFDPAPNTLSWRWVAGLHTPGKTYLPRRANIEKYLDPQLLAQAGPSGLELLESPEAQLPEHSGKPPITRQDLVSDAIPETAGLWIHEEDLSIAQSELANFSPQATLVTYDGERLEKIGASPNRIRWLKSATQDIASRRNVSHSHRLNLGEWARDNHLKDLVAFRPEIGPLHSQLPILREDLKKAGVTLHLIIRKEDAVLRPFAKAGFFPFWMKLQKRLKSGEFPPTQKLCQS
ncbi:MAG: FAD-binding domain-containing protein [Akkermansiaceae bacterium]